LRLLTGHHPNRRTHRLRAPALALPIAWSLLSATRAVAADNPAPSAQAQPTPEQACPGTLEQAQAAARKLLLRQPPIAQVTRPALQRELLLMEENDQSARRDWNAAEPAPETLAAIDAHDLRRLGEILRQDGFPTAAMVGYNGEAAAWLLLQHVPDESHLRDRWLPVLIRRARSGELSPDSLALTIDRALIASGKPQRYGTQGTFKDGELVIQPSEDPAHLDRRRASLGMVPEADYLCLLRFYTLHTPASANTEQ
jgi:hypothetical protein